MSSMEWSSVSWLWVLLVLLHSLFHVSMGCFEEERNALLDYKTFANVTDDTDPYFFPPNLTSWDDKSNCCAWPLVRCNHTTGRVIELSLNYTIPYDRDAVMYLNATIFLPFVDLQSLDLSSNNLDGWLKNEGFERLHGLTKLQVLDLSYNRLNSSSILSSLLGFSSLKSLSLAGNGIEGLIPIQGFERLHGLRKLQVLDLSHNYFNSSIVSSLLGFSSLKSLSLAANSMDEFQGFERLHGLRKLQVLDLSYNYFNSSSILSSLLGFSSLKSLSLAGNFMKGPIPIQDCTPLSSLEILDVSDNILSGEVPLCIWTLPYLKALSLYGNQLNGSLNSQGFCQLKNIQELDLGRNEFGGSLPTCLNNFTSLGLLDLSYNQFNGIIPSSLISSLKSLEFISLSHNQFEGSFSLSSIANHSKLEVFHFACDTNKLHIDTEYPHWVPTFQLKSLRLSNCNLNKHTGIIPSFLSYQYDLIEIDLSNNNLKGSFLGLLNNHTKLQMLYLQNNSFTGPFYLPSLSNRVIVLLDISSNRIHGHLPIDIGTILPTLEYLNISSNAFEGFIPSSIGEMRNLLSLDLSRNNFLGEIPKQITMGCTELKTLKLSNNRLHGQLFPSYFNLTRLTNLYLDSNNFTGKISNRILNSPYDLSTLEISNNSISGRLPSWIGNLTNLRILLMSKNNLDGTIPIEYCKMQRLEILDLSHNKLSGSLPSCFNSSSLICIYLQRNMFTGPISDGLSKISSLVTLDLRQNNFSGGIPIWIGTLSELKVLLLSENSLQGPIPVQLCMLEKISMLDLSHNILFGSIPSCLKNLTFGRNRTPDAFDQTLEEYYPLIGFPIWNYSPTDLLKKSVYFDSNNRWEKQLEVEFITKRRFESYKGYILKFMSGMDLSWNQLTGNIPREIGELSEIRALNLSHNCLTGSIPITFSNLKTIESMDLSYNSLSGEIPSQLTELYSLAIFNVSHNNLSGRTPDRGQFANFDESNYGGNPGLCGPLLLKKRCNEIEAPPSPSSNKGEDGVFDMVSFYWSFVASYIVELLGFITILSINTNWRRGWFRFIDTCISSCCNWF